MAKTMRMMMSGYSSAQAVPSNRVDEEHHECDLTMCGHPSE